MIYLTQRLDHPHRVTASVTLPIDIRVKSRYPESGAGWKLIARR